MTPSYTFRHPTDAVLGYARETVRLAPAGLQRAARTSRRRRDVESAQPRPPSVAVVQAVLGPARYRDPIRTVT